MATARSLISSCTPLPAPKYTRNGAAPAMVFTLLARPLPAKVRLPLASCTSTQESAEKLKRSRARPAPGGGTAAASDAGAAALLSIAGAATAAAGISLALTGDAVAEETTPDSAGPSGVAGAAATDAPATGGLPAGTLLR